MNKKITDILPAMVDEVAKHVDDGVLFVLPNNKILELAYEQLCERKVCLPSLIKKLQGNDGITLSPNTVANGVTDFKVVLSTKNSIEGITLSTLKTMVKTICLDNAASRKQLLGRINRLGGRHEEINILTVLGGVLFNIAERQRLGDSFLSSLTDLGIVM